MHFTSAACRPDGSPHSDKFYRVIVFDNLLLTYYGRAGARGQGGVEKLPDAAGALNRARTLTNQKERRGYVLTRDLTEIPVPPELDGGDPSSVRRHLGELFV